MSFYFILFRSVIYIGSYEVVCRYARIALMLRDTFNASRQSSPLPHPISPSVKIMPTRAYDFMIAICSQLYDNRLTQESYRETPTVFASDTEYSFRSTYFN